MFKSLGLAAGLAAGIALWAGGASAADLAVKGPVYKAPIAQVYDWTGLYAGANLGYSWGNSDTDTTIFNNATNAVLGAFSNSFDMNGWVGGLQIGYNWQASRSWVLGVEADIQLTGQRGSTSLVCPGAICSTNTAIPVANAPVGASLTQKLDWFGTLRARAGYLFTPTTLVYATGGLAVGGVKSEGVLTGFTAVGAPTSAGFSSSDTNIGWTLGFGVEGRISERWTAKLEYIYLDLGRFDTTAFLLTNAPAERVNFSSHVTDNIVRVGLNYHFNGPVVAKY